jgi:hypothetical protein
VSEEGGVVLAKSLEGIGPGLLEPNVKDDLTFHSSFPVSPNAGRLVALSVGVGWQRDLTPDYCSCFPDRWGQRRDKPAQRGGASILAAPSRAKRRRRIASDTRFAGDHDLLSVDENMRRRISRSHDRPRGAKPDLPFCSPRQNFFIAKKPKSIKGRALISVHELARSVTPIANQEASGPIG